MWSSPMVLPFYLNMHWLHQKWFWMIRYIFSFLNSHLKQENPWFWEVEQEKQQHLCYEESETIWKLLDLSLKATLPSAVGIWNCSFSSQHQRSCSFFSTRLHCLLFRCSLLLRNLWLGIAIFYLLQCSVYIFHILYIQLSLSCNCRHDTSFDLREAIMYAVHPKENIK